MKYYKQVSGKGRVALSQAEVKKLFENDLPIQEPKDEISVLKAEIENLSNMLKSLCSGESDASPLSKNGEGDVNGY